MKKISEELRYDGATIEQVHAMLADPAFREKVCDYQGVLRKTVTIDSAGKGMTVSIDQVQAAQSSDQTKQPGSGGPGPHRR